MKPTIVSAVLLCGALAGGSALAQVETRDHRDKVETRDHRDEVETRDHRKDKVKARDKADDRVDTRDHRDEADRRKDGPNRRDHRDGERGDVQTRDHRDGPERRDHRENRRPTETVESQVGNPARRGPDNRRRRGWYRERLLVSSFSPRAAKTGDTITILGRHFEPTVQVSLGGRPVTGATVKPRSITFRVPKSSPGEALITISHPDRRRPLVVGSLEVGVPGRAAEHKKEWARRRADAEKRWEQRRKQMAKDEAARIAALEAREAELRAQRAQRRAEALAAMKRRWKRAFLADEQTQIELALHAERKARLERIRRVAEVRDRGKLVVRAEIAIEREDARHERRMMALEAAFKMPGGAP